MTNPPSESPPPGDPDPQPRVERARARLLGGRGPGASSDEILRHTRARPRLADQPTPQYRAAVTRQTARARRDPDALAPQTPPATDRVADTPRPTSDPGPPTRETPAAGPPRARRPLLAAAVAVVIFRLGRRSAQRRYARY